LNDRGTVGDPRPAALGCLLARADNAHRPARPARFAATGRRWEGDGVSVGEYRDGRICRLRICLDMLGVSRQHGLMPAVGSRTERAMAGRQRVTSKLR
jgi:hypothetical protein